MKLRSALFALASSAALVVAASTGCGLGDFPAISAVTSVRILASRADEPYAKPGDTVHVDVLAVDGRTVKTTPMHVYWLPFACENPPDDLYYLCFEQLGGDGGTSSTMTTPSFLQPGRDLTPFLVEGPSYAVQIPDDIISSHTQQSPGMENYGLTILFNVACAGHLEVLAQTALASKQQIPLGCFDDNETQLDATQYVIGYTRIFTYSDRTNQNPVIDHMTFGTPTANATTVDLIAGVTTSVCSDSKQENCPAYSIDTSVPMSSWELDPATLDIDDQPTHEEIWVDYYATGGGGFDDDARLLWDSQRGLITDSSNKLYAAPTAGQGALYAVVHDSRDGANWVSFPVVAQ